jgi:hypothetical protein
MSDRMVKLCQTGCLIDNSCGHLWDMLSDVPLTFGPHIERCHTSDINGMPCRMLPGHPPFNVTATVEQTLG